MASRGAYSAGLIEDVDATVRETARDFTALYEARAYLVYNLALRTTCEPDKARDAARRAFLAQAAAEETPEALVPAVVQAALGDARNRPKPNDVGVTGEEELWKANAALAPPERAALALEALGDADAAEIAAGLGLSAEQGEPLLGRAHGAFAAAAGLTPEEAEQAYAELAWAEPPTELWESLYPAYYKALERRLKADAAAGGEQETVVLAPVQAPRRARRRSRLGWLAGIGLPVLLVAGALAFVNRPQAHHAATHTPISTTPDQFSSFDSQTPTSSPAAPTQSSSDTSPSTPQPLLAKKHKPLTPQELDHLRMQELQALQKYEKQQTDKRLSQAQRDYASQRAGALRDLAMRRAENDRRAKALARQQRQQARRERQLQRQQQSSGGGGGSQITIVQQGGSGGSGGGGSTGTQDPQKNCIQDQDTGQWICQQP